MKKFYSCVDKRCLFFDDDRNIIVKDIALYGEKPLVESDYKTFGFYRRATDDHDDLILATFTSKAKAKEISNLFNKVYDANFEPIEVTYL